MELRVLNYFLAVAQEGSLTAASARLHVSQPTLSRQLKELEQELGQKLFDRQSHGVKLTEAGMRLRDYANSVKSITDKIEQDFSAMRTKPLGDVYLGGIDGYLHTNAKLVSHVRAEQPGLIFHYHSCSSSEALAMLDHGLLDFAVVSRQVRVDHYASLSFALKCRWIAYTRTDNPLAAKQTVTADDLRNEPLLMYDQVLKAPPELNDFIPWFGCDLDKLNVVATSNLTSALKMFAREGAGTLIVWENLVRGQEGDMVGIPLDPPLIAWGRLAWHKHRPLRPAAAYVLDFIRNTAIEWQ